MNPKTVAEIKTYVQDFMIQARLDLNYTLKDASQFLNIQEHILKNYEKGIHSPPCDLLFFILQKYKANTYDFLFGLIEIQTRKI